MHEFFSHPLFRAALGGAISAGLTDIQAFRNMKSFHDALIYDWGVAAWRWFQGAILGVLTSLGVGAITN